MLGRFPGIDCRSADRYRIGGFSHAKFTPDRRNPQSIETVKSSLGGMTGVAFTSVRSHATLTRARVC